ncbi:DUF4369 domain-containing protein [Emticicia sp. 21SJ11W-3]|uniref:DUF4369 domain-containing protein n=1 Tax=Emticicia sp. 21SJ11W-3 TaxID=2916755 RepID=UPI00209D2550|nr:DUF4369 domain-containing protein [Emticicia sp. 21SJ11W-3]UTA69828.1 DUF4369 domain-containing protein [Emticicia sp. 21SJ11W-3]
MRILFIFFLLLFNLSAQAQRFRLTGEIKSLEEGSWVYLSYDVQGQRILDSTQVKAGVFQFSKKLKYPVYAYISESSYELYEGDNRFSFMLEPAKFSIYSDSHIYASEVKNSKLNEEGQELIRRILSFSFSMKRNSVIQEYPEYRRPGEKVILLSKNVEEREKQESILRDSICVEFAKAYPDSYQSAQVLASVMSWNETNSAIYQRAKNVFDRCPRRWKRAPAIREIIERKMPRTVFVMGELSFD